MKTFQFTLEPLRVLRERREREAMEAYAKALDQHRQAVELSRSADSELEAAMQEACERLAQGIPVGQVVQHQLYREFLMQRCKAAAADIVAAEQKVKEAVQLMMAARQQREVVDKVRENQRATYDHEAAIEEQKMIDELAGRRRENSLSWRTPEYD